MEVPKSSTYFMVTAGWLLIEGRGDGQSLLTQQVRLRPTKYIFPHLK